MFPMHAKNVALPHTSPIRSRQNQSSVLNVVLLFPWITWTRNLNVLICWQCGQVVATQTPMSCSALPMWIGSICNG